MVDEIPVGILKYGGDVDLEDGQGVVRHAGVEILIHALQLKFPDHHEANMFRAGLEFFSFVPRRSETAELIFIRFDMMLDKANMRAKRA